MVRRTKEEAEQTRRDIIEAARRVFHEHGVVRSSLEKIAKAAGVTRGAVYWHFRNKAELFFAMRDDAFAPMIGFTDAILVDPAWDNPLDAIEASTKAFIRALNDTAKFREVFEIMIIRCEYVDEFASVLAEINRPCHDLLARFQGLYTRAAEKGLLRSGLDPEHLAYDTLAFTSGAFHNWLAAAPGDDFRIRVATMVRNHMALRRA